MRKLMTSTALAMSIGGQALAEDWTVVVPPGLPEGSEAIKSEMWDFFTKTLGPGDRYTVLDGANVKRIAVFAIPDDASFKRAKRRLNTFRKENARVFERLEKMGSATASVDFLGGFRHVALNRINPSEPLSLLMIGDAAQRLPDRPSFSMRDDDGVFRVPSPAHLSAPLSATVWGLGSEGSNGLRNVAVHICNVGGKGALSDEEEDKLRTFWAHYVAQRGGVLATWSDELSTCFDRFEARITAPIIDEGPDPDDRLLTMREVGPADVALETRKDGKTVINGVEVEDFNLFAFAPHPTLAGVQVVTGVKYRPADYPEKYETAWCYFSVVKGGVEVKFDLGDKSPGAAPRFYGGGASALSTAGLNAADFEAGKPACQWPKS